MARFKVVQSAAWRESFCSVLFETDDEEMAVTQADLLSHGPPEDPYEVIDSWDSSNQFPPNVKALYTTPREVANFIAKRQRP